ncbi:MAG: hypothetical protein ACKV2T_02795 [Kofleriaceae bacterium]
MSERYLWIVLLAACGGGGGSGDDEPMDAAGDATGSGSDGGNAPDAMIDAMVDATAGPIDVPCSQFPVTLPGKDLGFRTNYGTICYHPAIFPGAPECRVVDTFAQNVGSYCDDTGILIGKFPSTSPSAGGEIYLAFSFGQQFVTVSGGTVIANQGRVLSIPDGQFTADFNVGVNNQPSTEVYRAVMTFNADGTLTVNSIGLVP